MTSHLRSFPLPQQPDTTIVETQQPAEISIQEPEEPQPVSKPATPKPHRDKTDTTALQDTAKQQAAVVSNKQEQPDTAKTIEKDYGPWITIRDFSHQGKPYLFNDSVIGKQRTENDAFGVTAKPAPYTISGDNIITGLLIISFILALISFANSRRFIARQAKSFFRTPNERTTPMTETTNEVRFQIFLVALTCLLGAIIFFFYTQEYVAQTFILSSQYQLVAIYFGIFVAYFLLKFGLHAGINWIFFNHRQNERWMKALLFISSMEGLLLFPVALLLVYFDLSMKTTVVYTLGVIIFIKILSFYKCYVIFFRKITSFLQIILYFCALEIIPIAILYGFLVLTNDFLRINY